MVEDLGFTGLGIYRTIPVCDLRESSRAQTTLLSLEPAALNPKPEILNLKRSPKP